MKILGGFFALIIITVLWSSCRPDPVFPVEPQLTFKEYIQHPNSDTLQVVFSFTDGDGDIGVAPQDTNKNMKLTVYHKNPAGQWVVVDDPNTPNPLDSLIYPFRIPKLVAGQIGLEGDIYLTFDRTILMQFADTVEFNGYLEDQSHHRSKWVKTPEVVILP